MRTFLVLFLLLSRAWAVDQSLLCGDLPKDEAATREAALVVEKAMPPVSNQSPTAWCYAFAGGDLINYYYHQSLGLESYSADNMVSPLELVSVYNTYRNNHSSSDVAPIENMDLDVGGSEYVAFLGIQERGYKVRSLEQIPTDSVDKDNPRAQELVKKLVEEYGGEDCIDCYRIAGVLCPKSLYETDEFQAEVYGFKFLNEWIYKMADYNGLLTSPFRVKNYEGIAALKGDQDIIVPPFSNHLYEGDDSEIFLKELQQALFTDKVPVSVALCTSDFDLESIDINAEDCGGHEMVLTSAFYQDGKCVVRLKNSWGTGWGDNGYLTMSLENFLKSVEHQRHGAGWNGRYRATWITEVREDSNQFFHEDQSIYKGDLAYQRFVGDSFLYQREEGFDYDRQGKRVEAYHQQWEGSFFTGEVKDYGSGQWEPQKGLSTNEQGVVSYAYSWPLQSGRLFTGTTKGSTDGSWSINSGIGRDDSGKAVYAYKYPMSDGVIFNGTISQVEDGSFVRESGIDYRDNKMVYVYNYKLSSGEIYTGAVRDNGNGTFSVQRGNQ